MSAIRKPTIGVPAAESKMARPNEVTTQGTRDESDSLPLITSNAVALEIADARGKRST